MCLSGCLAYRPAGIRGRSKRYGHPIKRRVASLRDLVRAPDGAAFCRRGIPLILVSHNFRQVFDLVDRIWVFRRGRIVGGVDRDKSSGNEIVSMITRVKSGVEGEAAFVSRHEKRAEPPL